MSGKKKGTPDSRYCEPLGLHYTHGEAITELAWHAVELESLQAERDALARRVAELLEEVSKYAGIVNLDRRVAADKDDHIRDLVADKVKLRLTLEGSHEPIA